MEKVLEVGADNGAACKFLEPYIQSGALNFLLGSGASFPAIGTAGDIEAAINADLLLGDEPSASLKCLEFLESINAAHQSLLTATPSGDVGAVLQNYQRFARVVDAILFARKSLLQPRQAAVFTTNYDLFLERAVAALPGIVLNDGFDRTDPLSAEFKFTPERYFDRTFRAGSSNGRSTEIPTINLVKLHGSLSWQQRAGNLVSRNAIAPVFDPKDKGNASAVDAYLSAHFLILPNMRKFHATLMDRVYYDLLRIYSRNLEADNAVLVAFGFSFIDEHILDLTRRSLRNPTAQLVIVSYDDASASAYEAKFADHRNVRIIAPGGGTIDFARLNNILEAIIPEASK